MKPARWRLLRAYIEHFARTGHYDGNAWKDNPMTTRAIVPPEFRASSDQLKFSPAILSGNHLFLSGTTGSDAQGNMPGDPGIQMRAAFDKIATVLRAADLTFQSVVEMTTYHIGLRDHFDLFDAIRLEYVADPFPAWTAVEVAGLRRVGAIVEIRVVARAGPRPQKPATP